MCNGLDDRIARATRVALVCAAVVGCSPRNALEIPHEADARRNLALNRAAYASSSSNYDNTAHLATDGVSSGEPEYASARGTLDARVSAGGAQTPPIAHAPLVSEWTSGALGAPWIYVDLGAPAKFDEVKFSWGASHPAAYALDVSDDASRWASVYTTSSSDGGVDDVRFSMASARYVRLRSLTAAPPAGISLREFEVYGTGGAAPRVAAVPPPESDGTQVLSGGHWKVQRASRVNASGRDVSKLGFDDRAWIPATVPGTVLTSYLDAGAVPDPNFGDLQFQVSDAFFTADFWYRDVFVVPRSFCGRHVWLDFDGIDWKADVFVNGEPAWTIDGAFTRGRFDVTPLATCGGENALAVSIRANDHPGAVKTKRLVSAGPNGGVLGADNPTLHASIGWDWMPTIRGRDTGIVDKVRLASSGDVSIHDPFVKTTLPLPKTAPADLTVTADLENHSDRTVTGRLRGIIEPGHVAFSVPETLAPSARETVRFDKNDVPALSLSHPNLWWPNGYGSPNLYTLELSFTVDGAVSDESTTRFGVRQVTSDTRDGVLTLYVNGRRIFVRGGNWGMSDALLRLDDRGYDDRVRLHAGENFDMIRNWIGMTGSDAFYDACDKYGILIWDDFWLANPSDGPDPLDAKLFLANARDKIRRVRKHPSVALYCGRNEGEPPENLAGGLERAVEELDGTRPYISNSAGGPVDGGGPYSIRDPKWYFEHAGPKIHSEIGLPAVPTADSLRAMMPAESLWPIGEMWGLHDYCNGAAGASRYTATIAQSYGASSGVDDFAEKAQLANFESERAIFEGYASGHRNGALLWMSEPAWPSTVWQTFDYYLESAGAYFGAKSGSEPLHVLWNPNTNDVEVANNTGEDAGRLEADATIYDLDGSQTYSKSNAVDAPSDSVTKCFTIAFPPDLSATHFLRLRLRRGESVVSENFYWRGTTYEDYTALARLAKVSVAGSVERRAGDASEKFSVTVVNSGSVVALMVRLKPVHARSNGRILPAYFSDNYFSLAPNETKTVTLEFDRGALDGDALSVLVEGWNVNPSELPVR